MANAPFGTPGSLIVSPIVGTAGVAPNGAGTTFEVKGGDGIGTGIGGDALLTGGKGTGIGATGGSAVLLGGEGDVLGGGVLMQGGGGVGGGGAFVAGGFGGSGGAGLVSIKTQNNTSGGGGPVGAISITGGNSGSTFEGGDINVTAGNAGGTGTGGDITVRAGTGGTSGGGAHGGTIDITGGTSGASGLAGAVTIRGGAPIASSASAGDVNLLGGAGTGSVNGGSAVVTGGASVSAVAGAVLITGGLSTGSTGGSVTISGGTSNSAGGNVAISGGTATSGATGGITISTPASTAAAGDINLTAGDSGGTSEGGDVTITAGSSTATGPGGDVIGTGGNSVTSVGGEVGLFGGTGGTSGGAANIRAGNGTSQGGAAALFGGNATGGAGLGGAVSITGGAGSGSGSGGGIVLTAGNAGATGPLGGQVLISGGEAFAANPGGNVILNGGGALNGTGGLAILEGGTPSGTGAGGLARVRGGGSVGGVGGDVLIDGGTGTTNGVVNIGTTAAQAVNIGRATKLTTILGNYADAQLPPSGVPAGTYATPSSITVGASGRVEAITGGSPPGSTGAKPTLSDKSLVPAASAGADDFDTGLTLTVTPDPSGFVAPRINGVVYTVAQSDAERATKVFYFGTVPGTALDMDGLTAGAKLFFNAAFAGFDLAITDLLDLDYDENHTTPANPTLADKFLVPAASAGADDFDTTLTIAAAPAASSYVGVRHNGVFYRVAQTEVERALGTSVFYFGTVPGTAVAMATLAGGEKLYFNAAVAGFDLAVTDNIDLDYNIDLGSTATIPTLENKAEVSATSTGVDNFDTGLVLATSPIANGYVGVRVNGVHYRVAQSDAERPTSPFYFGAVSGTATPMASLSSGSKLFFNEVVAGFALGATDILDIDYNAEPVTPAPTAVVASMLNKFETPAASAGADDFDTTLTVTGLPIANSYIAVLLNGVSYRVAQSNAQRAASVFYFGTVPGTALAMGAVTTGNKLFFNAVVAGFDLAITDTIDINYLS